MLRGGDQARAQNADRERPGEEESARLGVCGHRKRYACS